MILDDFYDLPKAALLFGVVGRGSGGGGGGGGVAAGEDDADVDADGLLVGADFARLSMSGDRETSEEDDLTG